MTSGTSVPLRGQTAPIALAPAHPTPPDASPAGWIPEIVARIVRDFRPLRVILFGSHARGDAHAESDIDLLVVMPDRFTGVRQRHTAVAMLDALRDLPVFKDVVVTTPDEIAHRGDLPGTVLRFALDEGKTLYERSPA
ncbi:MAG: nucleotidyltransferase domain-containing protein [Chloroflexota bacterium]|nr:nucleotidyltransferase domain-containing protein [Chloroflexota bacterium]